MKKALIFSMLVIALGSCDKNKKMAKRFAGETWAVTAISVGNENQSSFPTILFSDCDIYDELCTATWDVEGTTADMIWQLRDKAEVFEISNQSTLTQAMEPAIVQCMNLSGVYNVTTLEKEKMTISSTATHGYDGETVTITMQKQ